jgi:CubicO group peptidase (beta-lactamase class C family)
MGSTVIERISGATLGAYLHEHVIGPLGMRDTEF